ncbi:MAG: hypothetical protein ACPGSE_00460 [Synechococcus sp.]
MKKVLNGVGMGLGMGVAIALWPFALVGVAGAAAWKLATATKAKPQPRSLEPISNQLEDVRREALARVEAFNRQLEHERQLENLERCLAASGGHPEKTA